MYARALAVLLTAFVFVSAAAAPVARAQQLNSSDEVALIRDQLRLPQSTKVYLASSSGMRRSEPPRVFVAVGLDSAVRDYFRSQISRWNRDGATRTEFVTLVDDLQSANVVFLRFELPNRSWTETRSESYNVSTTDPSTGQQRTDVYSRPYDVTIVPSYTYLLTREPDGYAVQTRVAAAEPIGQDGRYAEVWASFRALKGKPEKKRRSFLGW